MKYLIYTSPRTICPGGKSHNVKGLAPEAADLRLPWFHICWDCRLVFQECEGIVPDVGDVKNLK
jgi:hypothetical protein